MNRVCVMPGGASNGDYHVGSMSVLRRDYDVYMLCSTGTLSGVLFACNKFSQAVEGYQNTTNVEMYGRLQPFNRKGKMSWRIALKSTAVLIPGRFHIYSIGKRIEKKVRKYFTARDHEYLQASGKVVLVAVKNWDVKRKKTEFINIADPSMSFDRAVDVIVASASIPWFSKPRIIAGAKYVDGGWFDPIPVKPIVESYRDSSVDIFLTHSKQDEEEILNPIDGFFESIFRFFVEMMYINRENNLNLIKSIGHKDCTLYYSPFKAGNSANFDQDVMRERIRQGRLDAAKGRIYTEKV